MIKLSNPLQNISHLSTAIERERWASDLISEIRRYLIRRVKKNGKKRPMSRGDYARLSISRPVTVQKLFELQELRDRMLKELLEQDTSTYNFNELYFG